MHRPHSPNPIILAACALAMAGAQAAGTPGCPGGPGYAAHQARIEPMRAPIEAAIQALDHARIELPSATLATGRPTHVSVSLPLPEQLDRVRVLGYFALAGQAHCEVPLLVSYIDAPSHNDSEAGAQPARIHFRLPDIDEFSSSLGAWQTVRLRIAAFRFEDGRLGQPYFGRELTFQTSSKSAGIAATLLFALGFYVLIAVTVGTVADRGASHGAAARGPLARLRLLAPWNLVAHDAHTALSQLQMLAFTLIVASLLFYHWMRTGLLHELSTDLLYLIGISTLGAAGSQLTATIRKGLDPAMYAYVQQLEWLTAPATRVHRRADPVALLTTNRRFDIYKFQMLVFSFVIAAYVIASGADQLATLHISATLLTLMGISQGAYVGGHVTSDGIAMLQDQLRGMRKLQERFRLSADPEVRRELRRRFRLAAARAGANFGALYGRELPDYMLDMPIDADTVPAAATHADPDAGDDVRQTWDKDDREDAG